MTLSDQDFDIVQLGIDALQGRLTELDLNLVVESDFSGLKAFLTSNGSFINPTYDPAVSDIGPRDYWFRVLDRFGNSIACMAERVFDTADFADLIRTGTLWWRDGALPHCGFESFAMAALPHPLDGTVSHSGAMWIDPDYRKVGLSTYLTHLSRLMCLRNHDISYNTGFVRKYLVDTPVPRVTYGYPHVQFCYSGYFPPAGGDEELYVCWISADEMVQQVRELPVHPRYPVPLPHVVQPEMPEAAAVT